jgi:hypothetical protein
MKEDYIHEGSRMVHIYRSKDFTARSDIHILIFFLDECADISTNGESDPVRSG